MGLQAVAGYFALDSLGAAFQHPLELDRNLLKGLFRDTSGRFRPTDFVPSPGGSNYQVQFTTGRAYLAGNESNTQGGYFTWSNSGVGPLTMAAPSASPRIDSFILRVYDNQYGTITGDPRAQIDIVQGTPGASPVAHPDSDFNTGGSQWVPGAWYRLCDVRINPGDTLIPSGQIYNNTQFVRMPGALSFCNSVNNTAGFGGHPAVPGSFEQIFELDTGLRGIWCPTAGLWSYSGLQAYQTTTSGSTNTIATDQLDANQPIVQFTVPADFAASWKYRVEVWGTLLQGTVQGDWWEITVKDGGASTPTTSSPIVAGTTYHAQDLAGNRTEQVVPVVDIMSGLSAGVHKLGLFTRRINGTGTLGINCGASNGAFGGRRGMAVYNVSY